MQTVNQYRFGSQSNQLRQLAAIELSKRIAEGNGDSWGHLPYEFREKLKEQVTALVLSDERQVSILSRFSS